MALGFINNDKYNDLVVIDEKQQAFAVYFFNS